MRERKKPQESWVQRAKREIENAEWDKVTEELVEKMCELYPQVPKEDIEFYVATGMLFCKINLQVSNQFTKFAKENEKIWKRRNK